MRSIERPKIEVPQIEMNENGGCQYYTAEQIADLIRDPSKPLPWRIRALDRLLLHRDGCPRDSMDAEILRVIKTRCAESVTKALEVAGTLVDEGISYSVEDGRIRRSLAWEPKKSLV